MLITTLLLLYLAIVFVAIGFFLDDMDTAAFVAGFIWPIILLVYLGGWLSDKRRGL